MRSATKILAGALGAAASVLGAELLARRVLRNGDQYYRYRPYVRQRLVIDRSALPALDAVSSVEINRDGERGGPPPGKGERAYRALVVGGSAAECYYLGQHQSWGAVAERILSQPEHLRALGVDRIHVGNIARAILPCNGVHQLLSRILPRYERLETILIMVGASDMIAWIEAKMPSTFSEGAVPAKNIFEEHPEGPFSFAPRRSALWQVASAQRRRFLRPVTITPDLGNWLHRVRKMRANASKMIDESPDPTPMLDRFEKWLRAIVVLCAAKAGRVVLVHQPWLGDTGDPELVKMLWNFGLGRPYKEDVHVYCTPRLVAHLMTLIDARVARVAADLGAEQINLLPLLERSARTYYDFMHFTPAGAEVVGRVVAAHLAKPASAARAPSSSDPEAGEHAASGELR